MTHLINDIRADSFPKTRYKTNKLSAIIPLRTRWKMQICRDDRSFANRSNKNGGCLCRAGYLLENKKKLRMLNVKSEWILRKIITKGLREKTKKV